MIDVRTRRRDRRRLADRLIAEYATAVPPGQVLAAVTRADLLLRTHAGTRPTQWQAKCESIARTTLAERAALRRGRRTGETRV